MNPLVGDYFRFTKWGRTQDFEKMLSFDPTYELFYNAKKEAALRRKITEEDFQGNFLSFLNNCARKHKRTSKEEITL